MLHALACPRLYQRVQLLRCPADADTQAAQPFLQCPEQCRCCGPSRRGPRRSRCNSSAVKRPPPSLAQFLVRPFALHLASQPLVGADAGGHPFLAGRPAPLRPQPAVGPGPRPAGAGLMPRHFFQVAACCSGLVRVLPPSLTSSAAALRQVFARAHCAWGASPASAYGPCSLPLSAVVRVSSSQC